MIKDKPTNRGKYFYDDSQFCSLDCHVVFKYYPEEVGLWWLNNHNYPSKSYAHPTHKRQKEQGILKGKGI